jgi:glycosyltransferase involved in cell wall biosynthesis
MTPIKIMNIIARLNVGGPAIHVALLTAKLSAPQYKSLLVCGNIEAGEGDMAYYARERGVEPIFIPELGRSLNPLRDITTLWKVYRLMRQHKPDIVHTHTAKAGFVGRIAARLAGVPVIVHTFHGHVFHGYFSPAKTRVFLWLERFTARFTDAIITLNDSLRDELADVYHIARKEKIVVLPLCLDLEAFSKTARKNGQFRAAWHIPADAPLVGIIGRLVPIKNHALFLQAAAKVRAKMPNARFAIVGDGETRADVEQSVDQLNLREAVIFTGWQKDLAPIYSDLDVSVISSDNEGTPVSVIEALVAGCAVVATAVGGVPEMLEQGRLGALVPPQDAEKLAAAMIHVLQNPPDVQNGRAAMLARYGLESVMLQITALYKKLFADKTVYSQ